MSWSIVRLADVQPVPWKNGGGVTRELLAWPAAGDWKVRMSVAEVAQDGPFSRFDGVRRWFAVLDGAGVRLQLNGSTHALTTRSAAFEFDGGAATDCTLIDGATQDFNLMLRGAAGRMGRVNGTQSLECSEGALVAVYNGPGDAAVAAGDGQAEIGPHTLAWRILVGGGAVHLEAADALWMEIAP